MDKGREDLSDEAVVKRVLAGETGCFRVILERYQKKVYAIGLRFFRNADDASDFTQEVFLRSYDRLGTFRGDSRFYSWIVRVAYNLGINAVRRARPEESMTEEYVRSATPGPESIHIRGEVASALREALAALPEKYRICLDLFFFMGLSYGEISEVTGYNVNTIKSHVFRAKKILRSSLHGTAAEDCDEM